MGIPVHHICLLRNLYAGQEATVRIGHGKTDWFKKGKLSQDCILSPCLFNAEQDEVQARIKIAGRNINNLSYADDTTLMAESKELKSLLLKLKEESKKVSLKFNIQKTKIMACGPITSWQIDGETMETVRNFYFSGLQDHCRWWLQPWNQKTLVPWKKSYDQPRQRIKKQRHYFANQNLSSQSYGFSSSHVWMGELDYKASWVSNNWCFWTVVLEKTFESLLDCEEIQPVNLKGNQSWIFIGSIDVEAVIPILWPPDVKNFLIRKDPDAGKDWRQEEKGMTEDGMVGWHHQLDGNEFEWALEVGDGQESLACCSPWGLKSRTQLSDWTEQNWIEYYINLPFTPKFGFWILNNLLLSKPLPFKP